MPRSDLWPLFVAIASGDRATIRRMLSADSDLATQAITTGGTRQSPTRFFLLPIGRQVYAGDTALHIAAAAYHKDIAADFVKRGADLRARNRRGAEPLHSAAIGGPGGATWNPKAQAAIITYLIRAGADPNAVDKSGVTPLHKAVRTRSSPAVRALLAHGADPHRTNHNGSTPFDLTVHNTGRSGSGEPAAKKEQAAIVEILRKHGA